MNAVMVNALGHIGAYSSLALASIGAAFATGTACAAAVGTWKKCYAQNKAAPFQLIIFAGSPISQAIYGMILMFIINDKVAEHCTSWATLLVVGVLSGIALGITSWIQGIVAAATCDAFGESGKGFVNFLMTIGIIETVSIFVMAFAIVLLATVA